MVLVRSQAEIDFYPRNEPRQSEQSELIRRAYNRMVDFYMSKRGGRS